MENIKPQKKYIYLSAMLPGLGQIFQKRWIAAISILCAFSACLILLFLVICQYIASGIKFASAFAEGLANTEPANSPVSAIISCLVLGLLVYIVSLFDAVLAYIREYRSFAEKKLMEKLKKSAMMLIIGTTLLVPTIGSADGIPTNSDQSTLSNKKIFNKKNLAIEMHRAIRENDINTVDLLTKKYGAIASQVDLPGGATPLHLAAALNREIITVILMANNANINAQTPSGFTPLHWAAGRDSVNTAKLLIANGADINSRAKQGTTPAHWAADKNATNVLKLLILSGADIYAKTDQKMYPLHWAVRKNSIDAANMLAYKQTSDEEKAGKLMVSPIKPPVLTTKLTIPPPSVETIKPSTVNSVANTSDSTASPLSLIVKIGHGQKLTFVRIESLKLWVGKYEITNGQFKRFDIKHQSMFRENFTLDGDDSPVVYVSWNDTKDYCKWLNNNFFDALPINSKCRLPTNKEWTQLASCGQMRTYPWGNDWPPLYGNFSDNAARKRLSNWKGIRKYNDGYIVTCPVDQSGSNEWGIFGLAGNVWEWCEDWYDDSNKYKIRRGGCWDFDSKDALEIKNLGFDRPNASYDTIGFRIVIATQ